MLFMHVRLFVASSREELANYHLLDPKACQFVRPLETRACQPLWCKFVPPLVRTVLGDITIILVGGTEFAIVELAAKIRSSIFRFLKERLSQLLLFVLIWRMCAFCFMLFESLSLFCHLLVYQYHVFYVVGCFSPYFFHCLARGERR